MALVSWILDDGPFGCLAQLADLAVLRSCEPGELLVAGTTAKFAANDKSGRRQALLELTYLDGSTVVTIVRVTFGVADPAAQTLAELHPDESATIDMAEHESIAWASAHGGNAILVTSDRRATVTALAELGNGRVAHPFDLWLHLRQKRGLNERDFRLLCESTHRGDQGLPRMPARVTQHFGSEPRR